MRLTLGRRRALLSYEMNVHRGENLRQFWRSIDDYVEPVRARVCPNAPFGIAPRIGTSLARELRSKSAQERLRAELEERGLFAFSINAFPLQDFHAQRVKEQVYAPAWTEAARVRDTVDIAGILATLLPDEVVGTVSTLGGTYRAWGHTAREFRKIGANYLRVVRAMIELERKTGKKIILTAEPEPDTTFETASDVVDLFEKHMLPQIDRVVAKPLKLRKGHAEELVRRHFQVNLDVCHQSVLFRDPVAEWKALTRAGLEVGKLHLTNALALPNARRSPAGLEQLRAFHEPRYLHQFAAQRPDGSLVRGGDLPELDTIDLAGVDEIRCHFHVPLSRAKIDRLTTTREDTARALAYALRRSPVPHLVVETYTWPLIEAGRDPAPIVRGITRELRWALGEIDARG